MKLNYQPIIEWARTRGILDQSTAQFQMLKATEEHGEMAGAILRGDRDELIDAIGDQLVVAIVQCAQLGYDVGEATYAIQTFGYKGNRPADDNLVLTQLARVTECQGNISGDMARSRYAFDNFQLLFTELARFCAVQNINPSDTLDSVYDIISKRGGEMRNGVWVKTEDL